MKIIILIIVTIIALCSYTCGYYYSFKEQYKRWYRKLFIDTGNAKPIQWSLSRMRNHNRYLLTLWALFASIVAFFVFIAFHIEEISSLWVLVASLFCTAILSIIACYIGKSAGKKDCDKRVKKECKNFECDIVWCLKNLQVYLGDFIYIKLDVLEDFKIHSSINLLYSIEI